MRVCLRCGYVEGEDAPQPYGWDEQGCPDWGIDGAPELRIDGEAEGRCPKCGASGEDWVEGH